jgi:glycosyltransferase involved in cell wall biosynthesis
MSNEKMKKKKDIHVVFVLANNSNAPYFNWFAKRAAKEKGIKMSFVCMFPDTPDMVKDVEQYGWNCYHINYDDKNRRKDMVVAFFSLYRLFKKLKPDVVSSHLFDDSVPSLFAAKLAGVPVRAITKGDTGFHYYNAPKWIAFDKFNNYNSTHIIAISQQNKSLIEMIESPPYEKIHMIHHGIPIDEITNQDKLLKDDILERYNLKGFKLVGNVSRLIPWKGQEIIIDVAERIIKNRKDVKFVLVGEGPDKDRLMSIIKSKSLQNHVILAGWIDRDAIPSFYGLIDIYCHTATKEPFGFVIAEALANGTPVISANTGVASDVIINGTNGYIVEEGDIEAFYNGLSDCLNRDLRIIGNNAKQTAKNYLDFELMYKNYFNLFKSALDLREE